MTMSLTDSKINSLPVRTRFLLVILLLAATVWGLYALFILPRRKQVAVLGQRINALSIEALKGQAAEARLPRFKQEVAKQQAHLDMLRQVLPEQKETAEIIRRIQQLAVESDLKIKSFTPQQTVGRDFYEDWPILISVEGSYSSLGLFLDKIGKFSRIINVDNISIKGLANPAGRRTLSATCTATTFVFLEASAQS